MTADGCRDDSSTRSKLKLTASVVAPLKTNVAQMPGVFHSALNDSACVAAFSGSKRQ
jgi:hypothetical protein